MKLHAWERELNNLDLLKDGWDDDGAPAPAPEAIAWAREVTHWAHHALQHVIIEVTPDATGGVGLYLRRGTKTVSLGYENNGCGSAFWPISAFVLYDDATDGDIVDHGSFDASSGRQAVLDFLNSADDAEALEEFLKHQVLDEA